MKKLLKDFDRYNRMDCAYTRKAIMPGNTFYSEMAWTGNRWSKRKVVHPSQAQEMVSAGEAEIVTRTQLNAAQPDEYPTPERQGA